MEKKTFTLEETDFNLRASRTMVCSIIDNQINNYKLQFLADWEGNHNTSSRDMDMKIQKLKTAKTDLIKWFKKHEGACPEIRLSIALEVNIPTQEPVGIPKEKLVVS